MAAPIPDFKAGGGGGRALPPMKTAAPVDVVGLAKLGATTVNAMNRAPASHSAGAASLAEAANRMFDDDAPIEEAPAPVSGEVPTIPTRTENGAPIAAFTMRKPTAPTVAVPVSARAPAAAPKRTLEALEGRKMSLAEMRHATRNLDESAPAPAAKPTRARPATVDEAFDEGPATGPVATDTALAARGVSLFASMSRTRR